MKRILIVTFLLLLVTAFTSAQTSSTGGTTVFGLPGGGGGSATPGGASGSLQYNNGGALGGVSTASFSTTTGTLNFTGNQPLQVNNLNLFPSVTSGGARIWGDSIACGAGAPHPYSQFANLVGYAAGGLISTYCTSGDATADTVWKFMYPSSVPAAQYNGTDYVEIGVNDANYDQTSGGGTTVNRQAMYLTFLTTLLSWQAIPNSSKVFAQSSACTPTSFAADNAGVSGYAESSTTNAATLSCNITTTGGPIILYYKWIDSNAGTASVKIDGVTKTAINGFAPQAINTPNGTTTSIANTIYTGVAAGAHTVLVTVTSATGAGNNVSIVAVATPVLPNAVGAPAPGAPRVFHGGVLHQQSGQNDNYTSIYDTIAQGVVATLQGYGLPVFFSDTRDAVGTTNFLNQLHPNQAGHALLASAYVNSSQPLGMVSEGPGWTLQQYPTLALDAGSTNSQSSSTQSTLWVAQSFTPTTAVTLGDIQFQWKFSTTITNATIGFQTFIYSDTGSNAPNALVATCNLLKYNNITASFAYASMGTCNSFTLTAGTKYWAVFKELSAPTGGSIVYASSSTINTVATSPDGITWTLNGTGPIGLWVFGSTNPTLNVNCIAANCLNLTSVNAPAINIQDTNGNAIVVNSKNVFGVQASSTNGVALSGTSTNNVGVTGASTTTAGVQGTSTNSVGGNFTGGSGFGDVLLATGKIRCTENATVPTGAAGIDFLACNTTDHTFAMNNNNGTLTNLMQRFTTNSTYTNATTTFSNVTTLAFPVTASRNYTATCYIMWQGSAATTGPKYQWTGPASPTAVIASTWSNVTASTYTTATATAFSSAMANAGTVTLATNFMDVLNISVINGANAGTVQLQAAANGTGTLTIQNGSYCLVQ